VDSFNLLVRCSDDVVSEPDAVQFLTNHGFDFEKQSSSGLPYCRGNDKEDEDMTRPSIRTFFGELIMSKKAISLHNGFLDLMFIHHHFYAEIPKKLQTFVANLSQMFPMGIFDTKYVTEFVARLKSSYLEFVFYMRQRSNMERMMQNRVHISVDFEDSSERDGVESRDMSTIILGHRPPGTKVCPQYSEHGWCEKGTNCDMSHDIDYILDTKRQVKESKKKRQTKLSKLKKLRDFSENLREAGHEPDVDMDMGTEAETDQGPDLEPEEVTTLPSTTSTPDSVQGMTKSGAHRSGVDAFMTGFITATYLSQYSKRPMTGTTFDTNQMGLKDMVNNVYLVGRDQPLKIVSSSFSNTSKGHQEKLQRLKSMSLFLK
jgi:target of EGR1 protein 1